MIEVEASQHRFPTARGMASVTSLLELAAMWIDVARGAGIKLHVLISRRADG
jgi:hypothetical protein